MKAESESSSDGGASDRAGTVTVAATCFGVSIAVSCPRPYAPAMLSTALPCVAEHIDPSAKVEHNFSVEPYAILSDHVVVKREGVPLAFPEPFESAMRTLQKEICWTIAEGTRNYAVVHAGVIAWNNIVAVLPGSSHDGKSTLVWSLVQAGATYFSDEYAVFDDDGLVHPFPVPINLRGQPRDVTVSPLRVATAPASPSLLAVTRYDREAVWAPRALNRGEALMALVLHSISIRSNPGAVLPVLKNVASQSQGFAGLRGDAEQLVSWLNSIACKCLHM